MPVLVLFKLHFSLAFAALAETTVVNTTSAY